MIIDKAHAIKKEEFKDKIVLVTGAIGVSD